MKKVIAGVFISLDGVVENPHHWHFPYFNDEMGAAVSATLGRADTVLFGRVTYDSFAGAWPARSATPARLSCPASTWSSPGGTPSSSMATWSRQSLHSSKSLARGSSV